MLVSEVPLLRVRHVKGYCCVVRSAVGRTCRCIMWYGIRFGLPRPPPARRLLDSLRYPNCLWCTHRYPTYPQPRLSVCARQTDMAEFQQNHPQFSQGLLSFALEFLLANKWPSNTLMDDYNECDVACAVGQTESCGCTCTTDPFDWTDDEVRGIGVTSWCRGGGRGWFCRERCRLSVIDYSSCVFQVWVTLKTLVFICLVTVDFNERLPSLVPPGIRFHGRHYVLPVRQG